MLNNHIMKNNTTVKQINNVIPIPQANWPIEDLELLHKLPECTFYILPNAFLVTAKVFFFVGDWILNGRNKDGPGRVDAIHKEVHVITPFAIQKIRPLCLHVKGTIQYGCHNHTSIKNVYIIQRSSLSKKMMPYPCISIRNGFQNCNKVD